MTISFNEIGNDIRTPFAFVEFDASRAQQGSSIMPYKVLVMGQKLPGGEIAALTPTRVTSQAQAAKYFGQGSQLHRMADVYFANNETTETIFCALDDEPAGVAASGKLVFAGTPTNGGTLSLYLGDRRVRVGLTPAMLAEDMATAVATAVNGLALSPVLASATSATVTFTAKHKGEAGNNIIIRLGYYDGEGLPQGVTVNKPGETIAPLISGSPTLCDEASAGIAAVAAYYGAIDPARPLQTLPIKGLLPPLMGTGLRLTGGSGNPELAPVWAAIGDVHYHILALPYTDGANLMSVKEELTRRRGPMYMIGGLAITCVNDSLSAQGTLGDNHNSENLCITGIGGPFERRERNLLLWDGISTLYTDADGLMRVERLITTYKQNALAAEDRAYLDVETLLTLEYLRYDFRNYFARKYPRHKLANDGTRYGKGQAIITPKIAKAECVAWFTMMENKGLVENVDQFKADLIVERNADNECRLDIYLPPNLINQLRVLAAQMAFRL